MKNISKILLIIFLWTPVTAFSATPPSDLNTAKDVVDNINNSMAATPDNTEPVTKLKFEMFTNAVSDDDLIYNMIKKLIGQPISEIKSAVTSAAGGETPSASEAGTTVVTKTIVLLSTIATFFVSVMILYIFSVAMFQQARTGTFLGEKWDSWLVPMRIALSSGAIIPIPKFGGLNGAQVMLTILFLMSIGIANFIANNFVSSSFNEKLINPISIKSNSPVSVNIIKNQLCLLVFNENNSSKLKIHNRNLTAEKTVRAFDFTDFFLPAPTEYHAGIDYGEDQECGSIIINKTIGDANELDKATFNELVKILPNALKKLDRDLLPVSKALFSTLYKKETPSPTFLVAKETVSSALIEFNKKISEVVTFTQDDFKDDSFIKASKMMERGGFALLGAYYWAMVDRQGTITDNYYNYTNSDNYVSYNQLDEDAFTEERLEEVRELYSEIVKIATVLAPGELSDDINYYTSDKDIWQDIQTGYMALVEGLVLEEHGGEIDPMLTIRTMGNTILATTFAFNLTMITIEAAAEATKSAGTAVPFVGAVAAGGGGFVSSLIQGIMDTLGTALTVMYAVGLIMAVLIPMMPFLMMTIGIIGILIYYLSALGGVTFWMAIHAHPGGHEIYGKGGKGYGVLFTLLLRPVFMVVGFAIGMGIFRVGADLFISLYSTAFLMSTASGTSLGIGTAIGYPVLLAAVLMALAYKSFQLSYELHNFIYNWMEFGDQNDMGEVDAKGVIAGFYASQGASQVGQEIGKAQGSSEGQEQGGGGESDGQTEEPPSPERSSDNLLQSAKTSSNNR